MAIVERIDHVEQGLSRLLSQFNESPYLQEFLTIYLEKAQEIEDALFEILTERGIFTAVGQQLDVIGLLFNISRLGRDDPTYRAALFEAISKSSSSGTHSEIILALRLLAQTDDVKLFEHGPAEFIASVGGAVDTNVIKSLQQIKAAGVNANRVYFKNNLPTLSGSEIGTFQDFLVNNNLENIVTGDLEALEVQFNARVVQGNSVPAELPYESSYLILDTGDYLVTDQGDRLVLLGKPLRPASGNSPLAEQGNINLI